jgi:hypothetical protein
MEDQASAGAVDRPVPAPVRTTGPGLSLPCVHRIVKDLVEQDLPEGQGYEMHRATGGAVRPSVLEGRDVLVVDSLAGTRSAAALRNAAGCLDRRIRADARPVSPQ